LCAFASAHYADVQHEVRPITKGYRLALTYNLIYRGSAAPPKAPGGLHVARLLRAVKDWEADARPDAPRFLMHVLQHEYTAAGLGLGNLKGEDRQAGALLASAVHKERLVVASARLTVDEHAHDGGGGGYRGGDDWEVDSRESKLVDLEDVDGGGFEMDSVSFREANVLGDFDELLDDMNPEDETFEVSVHSFVLPSGGALVPG
jgi:hypothetical protein